MKEDPRQGSKKQKAQDREETEQPNVQNRNQPWPPLIQEVIDTEYHWTEQKWQYYKWRNTGYYQDRTTTNHWQAPDSSSRRNQNLFRRNWNQRIAPWLRTRARRTHHWSTGISIPITEAGEFPAQILKVETPKTRLQELDNMAAKETRINLPKDSLETEMMYPHSYRMWICTS